MDVWDIISVPLSVLVFILHSYGLFLMWRLRFNCSSKYKLIASFSICNILYALYNLIRFPLAYHAPVAYSYFYVIMEGVRIPFYGTMCLLTAERFLEVFLHMNYQKSFFNIHKLKLVIVLWFASFAWLVLSIVLLVLCRTRESHEKTRSILLEWISVRISCAFHLLIIVQFVCVYTYIYVQVRSTRHACKQLTNYNIQNTRGRVFVPFFIVITFIAFDTVPDMFIIFAQQKYQSWILLFFRIDTLLNAVMYMFLQPRVKKRLSRKFRESRVIRAQMENLVLMVSPDKPPRKMNDNTEKLSEILSEEKVSADST